MAPSGRVRYIDQWVVLLWFTLFSFPGRHARTAGLLVAMVIPGSLMFLVIIKVADAGHTSLSPRFLFTYLLMAILQVRDTLLI